MKPESRVLATATAALTLLVAAAGLRFAFRQWGTHAPAPAPAATAEAATDSLRTPASTPKPSGRETSPLDLARFRARVGHVLERLELRAPSTELYRVYRGDHVIQDPSLAELLDELRSAREEDACAFVVDYFSTCLSTARTLGFDSHSRRIAAEYTLAHALAELAAARKLEIPALVGVGCGLLQSQEPRLRLLGTVLPSLLPNASYAALLEREMSFRAREVEFSHGATQMVRALRHCGSVDSIGPLLRFAAEHGGHLYAAESIAALAHGERGLTALATLMETDPSPSGISTILLTKMMEARLPDAGVFELMAGTKSPAAKLQLYSTWSSFCVPRDAGPQKAAAMIEHLSTWQQPDLRAAALAGVCMWGSESQRLYALDSARERVAPSDWALTLANNWRRSDGAFREGLLDLTARSSPQLQRALLDSIEQLRGRPGSDTQADPWAALLDLLAAPSVDEGVRERARRIAQGR